MQAVTEAALDVLDVGAGRSATARALFPGGRVTTVDVDPLTEPDFCHDITQPFPAEMAQSFDVVVASHVLEHLETLDVVPTLKNLRSLLKQGGLIFVIVPSLEWCARELLKDSPSPVVLACIYGTGNSTQAHRTGFTLSFLRSVLGMAGFRTRHANSEPFTVRLGEKDYQAVQNFVVAFRPKEE